MEAPVLQPSHDFRRQVFHVADQITIVGDVGGAINGPTVVLMHGGGQTRHSWGAAMRALAAIGYYVINIDARGHGESSWSPDGDYGFDNHVEDLRGVLAGKRGPVALVGASMGGITALVATAENIQPSPAAIVLVDVVPRLDPSGAARVTDFMRKHLAGFATLEEAAEAVTAYNPNRPRPVDIAGLRKNLRKRSDERLYWHWDPSMLAGSGQPDIHVLAERLIAYTSQIHAPTLLVRGANSDVVSDDAVREFKDHLPSLEIFNVPGAGHMIAGDRNDVFNEAIVQFLKRHVPVTI